MIKPIEIAFDDVINDILLVECHCMLFYIWISECPKYRYPPPAISHLLCTQKGFCRCEYRGDYSAALCVRSLTGKFGPTVWQWNRNDRTKFHPIEPSTAYPQILL